MSPVAGASNVMPIKSLSSFSSAAMSATKAAIANAQQVSSGPTGNSTISIRA